MDEVTAEFPMFEFTFTCFRVWVFGGVGLRIEEGTGERGGGVRTATGVRAPACPSIHATSHMNGQHPYNIQRQKQSIIYTP